MLGRKKRKTDVAVNHFSLMNLPPEILPKVCEFISDGRDLLATELTCKHLGFFATAEKQRSRAHWPRDYAAPLSQKTYDFQFTGEHLNEIARAVGVSQQHVVFSLWDGRAYLLNLLTTQHTLIPDVDVTSMARLDAKRLLLGCKNGDIVIFNIETKEKMVLQGHTHPVCDIVVDENRRIASGSSDRNIKLWIWDETTSEYRCEKTLNDNDHTSQLMSLRFIADNKLANISGNNNVIVWDLSLGQTWKQFYAPPFTHLKFVVQLSNNQIAAGNRHGKLAVWNVDANQAAVRFDNDVRSRSVCYAEIAPGIIATGAYEGIIRIRDLRDNTILSAFAVSSSIRSLTVMPDGRLLSVLSGNTITIQNFKLAPRLNAMDVDADPVAPHATILR